MQSTEKGRLKESNCTRSERKHSKFKNYENSPSGEFCNKSNSDPETFDFQFLDFTHNGNIFDSEGRFGCFAGSLTFINEQMGSIVDMEGFRLWIQNISFAFILCAVILLVVSL